MQGACRRTTGFIPSVPARCWVVSGSVRLPSTTEFAALCDGLFLDRFPSLSIALFLIHAVHVVLIGAWTPPDETRALWRLVQLATQGGQGALIVLLAIVATRHRISSRWLRGALMLSYVAFGSIISGVDQWRSIPPIGFGAAVLGLAAVFQYRTRTSAMFFSAAAVAGTVAAWAFGPADASIPLLNCVAIAGVGYAVAQTSSHARWNAYLRELESDRANIRLAELNTRLQAEIARRRKTEEELARLATVDPLTSLLNRRGIVDALEGTPSSSTVLLVDIDHFKQINDTFGHAVGDAVLVHVASALRAGVRRGDLVGRLGGDELAVLLLSLSEPDAVRIAEELRVGVATMPSAERLPPVTVSIGVATKESEETVEAWLARADLALYTAKAAGRNHVSLAA